MKIIQDALDSYGAMIGEELLGTHLYAEAAAGHEAAEKELAELKQELLELFTAWESGNDSIMDTAMSSLRGRVTPE